MLNFSAMGSAPHGFAYLFERFPSFSQTFCVREVDAMRRLGVEFPVFSIRDPSDEPEQNSRSVGEVHYLPERFDGILAEDVDFRRAARKAQADLRNLWGCEKEKRRVYEALWLGPRLQAAGIRHVHVHFAGTGARTAFWLNRLFAIDYSVTAHANDIFRDEPPERLAQIFDRARVVVTVSDFSVAYLREHFPASREKFHRVYNGIEMERFLPGNPEGDPPLLLSVGRYIEKKGFCDLLSACRHLKERKFSCQIVGLGPLEEGLKDQVALLGLSNQVTITGPRSEDEIRALLRRASAFVLPCVYASDGAVDNLPTVIMEAMATGVPVVSTTLAGIPEMVVDGQTGFLVPEKDPLAVADRVRRLLDDPAAARKMGEAGRTRCAEHFETKRTTAALIACLQAHGALPDVGSLARNSA